MKKLLIPTFCFAVLSTVAFEEHISAAPLTAEQINIETTTKYVNVSSGSLNMRKSASTNASVVSKLSKGTKVTVYSQSKGWSKIRVSGKDGYVSSEYLSNAKPSVKSTNIVTSTKYVSVSSGSLLMRKSGSSSASVVDKLAKGTKVTFYSESKGWSKIKVNGKTGYVSAKYLTTKKPGAVTLATTTVKTTTKYVKVSSGNLLLRKSASANASIVSKLPKGKKVMFYSESKGWAKIKVDGKTGYVSSKYLTTTKPVSATTAATPVKTTTKYVKVSSGTLTMRKSGSATASVVTKLAKDTKVTFYSESKGWSKIKADGKTGYVNSKYLTTTKPVAVTAPVKTTTKYVKVSSGTLTMRKSDSATASVVTKLAKDTKVTFYSESKGWAKIKVDGKTGYVNAKYLTTTKPVAATAPVKTTTKYVKVSSGNLLMRKSGSATASIVAKLAKDTKVTFYSESKGWAKIKVDGKTGYVSAKYLTTTKPVTGNLASTPDKTTTMYVNVSSGSLNMRNQPSEKASIILKLAKGVEVSVLSEANGWSKIKVYGGEGYVSTAYLSPKKPATTEKVPDEKPDIEENVVVKFVKVNDGSNLNMRSAGSATATIVAELVNNTAVTVYSESNGWSKVSANGKTGYVNSKYLVDQAEETPGNSTGTISKVYSEYNLTLDQMVDYQMSVNAQTDSRYQTYIREDGLTLTSATKGTVNGTGWRVRGGAGPENWVVGTVNENQSLTVLSTVKGTDGYSWYEVDINKTWVNASPTDVKYYLNPDNFVDDSINSFQFVKLSQVTNLNATEVNDRILSGKGILQGQAATFISAGEKYGVNEMYLISHALLETGKGTSPLSTGVIVNGKTVYNMYGIGAYDGTAVSSGAQYAYNAGWFTPEAAIIGGAEFIAKGYISSGQDTLYKMRWNPAAAAKYGYATHQYATDIGWASKQVKQIYNLYSLLDSYTLKFEIPKYK